MGAGEKKGHFVLFYFKIIFDNQAVCRQQFTALGKVPIEKCVEEQPSDLIT